MSCNAHPLPAASPSQLLTASCPGHDRSSRALQLALKYQPLSPQPQSDFHPLNLTTHPHHHPVDQTGHRAGGNWRRRSCNPKHRRWNRALRGRCLFLSGVFCNILSHFILQHNLHFFSPSHLCPLASAFQLSSSWEAVTTTGSLMQGDG
jgi:hypothetical protein